MTVALAAGLPAVLLVGVAWRVFPGLARVSWLVVGVNVAVAILVVPRAAGATIRWGAALDDVGGKTLALTAAQLALAYLALVCLWVVRIARDAAAPLVRR